MLQCDIRRPNNDILSIGKQLLHQIPKLVHPIEQKEIKNPVVIPKAFFKGMRVFIRFLDRRYSEHAKLALNNAGAEVLDDCTILPNIIVSDSPLTMPKLQISNAQEFTTDKASDVSQKKPVLVYLNQIPWIIPKDREMYNKLERETDQASEPMVVVSDSNLECQLISRTVQSLPALHFDEVPKGYTVSPFDMIPEDFEPVMRNLKNMVRNETSGICKMGPLDGMFCNICGCHYQSANEHHESYEHLCHSSSSREWDRFDQISAIVTKRLMFNNRVERK